MVHSPVLEPSHESGTSSGQCLIRVANRPSLLMMLASTEM